ncbi:MAG: cupin [Verrucomicrobiota bacterium]
MPASGGRCLMKPPESHWFADSGTIPNNPRLPVVIYRDAAPHDADEIETLFHRHGWPPAWRYIVYPYAHYHSTAHEVIGVYRGTARLRLGHDAGEIFEVGPGDVIVLPAGTGHENLGASADFHAVGAYPSDQEPDMRYGRPTERPAALERISQVPLPMSDPVCGKGGPLEQLWLVT